MSRYITSANRFAVILESSDHCVYCGSKNDPAEWDHVIPYSLTQNNHNANIQVICKKCNRKKSNKMNEKYIINYSGLFKHQEATLKAIKKYPYGSEKNGDRSLASIYHSTSAGKTLTMILDAFQSANMGEKVLIACPSTATLERFKEEYDKIKGKFLDGKIPDKLSILNGKLAEKASFNFAIKQNDVIVVGTHYLLEKIKEGCFASFFTSINSLIMEEGHHMAAPEWQKIVKACTNAKLRSYSGTPIREDKRRQLYGNYKIEKLRDGKVKYTVLDVAAVTGIKEARFTRKDADRLNLIKKSKIRILDQKDCIIPLQNGDAICNSLREAMKKGEEEGFLVKVYRNPDILRKALEKCLEIHHDYNRGVPLNIVKPSVIVRVHQTEDCELVAKIANEVGWKAVPYYYSVDNTKLNQMKSNKGNFEKLTNSTNMIIQCRTLHEGYDNNSIYMTILLTNSAWYSDMEQFFGRAIRKNEYLPEAVHIGLDIGNIKKDMIKYEKMETDISWICDEDVAEGSSIPTTNTMKPVLPFLDPGETQIVYGQETSTMWINKVKHLIKNGDCVGALEAAGHLENILNGNGVCHEIKLTAPADFDIARAKSMREEIKNDVVKRCYSHSYEGYLLDELIPDEKERKHIVCKCFCIAVNNKYPKIKGWTSNPKLDPDEAWGFINDAKNNEDALFDLTVKIIKNKVKHIISSI
jgi:superfamily II DNA or RNA helicase